MEVTKTTASPKKDLFFWIIIVALVASAIFANGYFKELAWALRFSLWILLIGVVIGLALLTTQGRQLWTFIKNAQIELRKVVWPSRDETVKTTAIVAALVFAMSIILWVLDSSLLKLVSWFTKQ